MTNNTVTPANTAVTTKVTIKEVIVPPLAAGRELLGLMVAIILIVLLAGLRFAQVAPKHGKTENKSYQIRDIRLKNQAPELYRSLLGSVGDITWSYESDGDWPDVSLLEEQSLPPFAKNFLQVGLRGFTWEQHRGATWIDYYGVNENVARTEKEGADPLENSFILRIIDLQAETYPYPYIPSENQENRFSAQIWINQQTVDYPEGSLAERGWKWIISGNTASAEKIVEQNNN